MSETATRRANRLGDVFIVEELLAASQQPDLETGDVLIRDEIKAKYSGFSLYRGGILHERWSVQGGVGRFLFNVGDLPREMLGGLVGIGLVSSHDQGEGSPLAAGRDEMRGSI